jgi:hypothetical protein
MIHHATLTMVVDCKRKRSSEVFMPITYFGKAHDAPIYKHTFHVPTPVGQSCMHCGEGILEGEDGFQTDEKSPFHRECFLRLLSGSVAHQMRACSCFLGDQAVDCEEGLSRRHSARLAMAYFGSAHIE